MSGFLEGMAKALAGSILFVATMMMLSLLGALMGAFSGWAASVIMPVWIPSGLSFIGIKVSAGDLPLLGAALGWFGAFFRTRLDPKTSKS